MRKTTSKNYDTEQIIRQKIEEDLDNGKELYKFSFKIAHTIILDFHESEDATQDSLMKLWEKGGYYRHPVDRKIPLLKDTKMKAWINKIGKNSAIDVVKKRWSFKKSNILYSDYFRRKNEYSYDKENPFLEEFAVSEETPVSLLVKSEEKEIVAKMIPELPGCIRDVIEMFYYGGKKYREIAEELNVPIGTVKSRLNRAKGVLRKRLEESPLCNTYN